MGEWFKENKFTAIIYVVEIVAFTTIAIVAILNK